MAVTHPRNAVQVQLLPDALAEKGVRHQCRFFGVTARSSIGERTPAPQAGRMGSTPIRATDWPSGGTGRHTTLRTSGRNRRGSSTLPLVTAEWTGVWFPARSHKPYDAGSNPASATSEGRRMKVEGETENEPAALVLSFIFRLHPLRGRLDVLVV